MEIQRQIQALQYRFISMIKLIHFINTQATKLSSFIDRNEVGCWFGAFVVAFFILLFNLTER
jgi:hypothetical protein